MIELTEEQRQELEQPGPVQARDPLTNETYVLVRTATYERLGMLMEEDDVRRMQPLLADLAPEDWEDAANYESKR